MALSGNTRELSLSDLTLAKAQDSGSCRVLISGPAGDGTLLIEGVLVSTWTYVDVRFESP